MVYCSHIKNSHKMCKNHIYQKDLCYIHYHQLPGKKVTFNEKKNTIKVISRYIGNLPRLKTGLWKYDIVKKPKRKRKNW